MSPNIQNEAVVLSERPGKGSITDKTFKQIKTDLREMREGDVRVRVTYASVDPTMRTWINDVRGYLPPVKIGDPMRAMGVGRVIESKSEKFQQGDIVYGTLNWQTIWQGRDKNIQKLSIPKGGKDIDYLGLFGTSGMTAYFGMFDIGRLKDGDNVVISGAAGSVGLIATQIALAHPKCTVTGIAGSPSKCAELKSMGVHHALNYKDKDFKKQLRSVGLIDVYFDNVGGEILDQVLTQLQLKARIISCGAIAAYNAKTPPPVYNLATLVSTRSRIEGFIILDYESRYPEAQAYLADQLQRGRMKYDYHIVKPGSGKSNGLGGCVPALQDVFEGRNFGKTVVQVSLDQKSKL